MFETYERPVARVWPIFMYGTYCLAGLGFVALSVSRHGLAQPARLVLSGLIFCLALIWLVATLRTSTPPTSGNVGQRGIILLGLLMALSSSSLFR
jgi:hypothetical protein